MKSGMIREHEIFVIFITFWTSFFGPVSNACGQSLPQLTTYLDSAAESSWANTCGYQITIFSDKDMFTHCLGSAERGQAINESHIFNIGSTTKTFTAVLILQEIDKGTLILEDSIGKFFPDIPNVNSSITIRQLLTHTSLLGEVGSAENINRAILDPLDSINFRSTLYRIPVRQNLGAADSSFFEYCNTNYVLLGFILEILNDRSYFDLVEERIFSRIKMNNSRGYPSRGDSKLTHPIVDQRDLWSMISFRYYTSLCFSAGSIVSNSSDLAIFFRKLFVDRVFLSGDMIREMVVFPESGYGFGIEEYSVDGIKFWGHDGDNVGYGSRVYFQPDSNFIVVVLSNCSDYQMLDQISKDIIGIAKDW